MKPSLAVLLLVGVAACSHSPQAVGAPPPGIAYRLDDGSTDQQADQYCQHYGKHAQAPSVKRDGDAQIATYACR